MSIQQSIERHPIRGRPGRGIAGGGVVLTFHGAGQHGRDLPHLGLEVIGKQMDPDVLGRTNLQLGKRRDVRPRLRLLDQQLADFLDRPAMPAG